MFSVSSGYGFSWSKVGVPGGHRSGALYLGRQEIQGCYQNQDKVRFFIMLWVYTVNFCLILYVQSTNFQLYRDVSSWVKPVLS